MSKQRISYVPRERMDEAALAYAEALAQSKAAPEYWAKAQDTKNAAWSVATRDP